MKKTKDEFIEEVVNRDTKELVKLCEEIKDPTLQKIAHSMLQQTIETKRYFALKQYEARTREGEVLEEE